MDVVNRYLPVLFAEKSGTLISSDRLRNHEPHIIHDKNHDQFMKIKTPVLRKSLSVILLCCIALGSCRETKTAAADYTRPSRDERPNILWLVTEDISPYLACYGDSTARTPNIDRLAREGMRFTHCFDVSGVCAPSRSSLITGMYPSSIGTDNMRTTQVYNIPGLVPYSTVLPPQVKMFSQLMREGGYYCTNNDKQDYQFKGLRAGWDESSKTAHWRNGPKGKPFFAVFNFGVTHESQVWVKKNDPLLVDPAKVPLPPYYPESPVIRKDVARMYSNIEEMDKQVGVLLKELEEDGLLEKTIIVWYSDNGGPLPRGKREIYDSGIRIPLIIRFPHKQFAGTVNDDMVSFVDFGPTMLSLAGLPVPSYMQGRAFLGSEKSPEGRRYVFAARDRMDSEYDMVRAVRDKRYEYLRNFHPERPYMQDIEYRKQMDLMKELLRLDKEGKLNAVQQLWFRKTKPVEELYDTQTDPYEFHNLADDSAYSGKLNELRAVLDEWMKYTDDKGFIPENQMLASMWPGLKQPVTADPSVLENGMISLRCETPGSTVSWQWLDPGKDVDEHNWAIYQHPLQPKPGKTLAIIAERIGYAASKVIKYKFPTP